MVETRLPIPDPTVLTTEQLRRELSGLRELLETRIGGMDKATELLKENVRLVSIDTDKQLSHLKELHDEKFESIQTQFKERDVRSDQDKIAATTAVNAALQAQKEAAASQNSSNAAAITKSEGTTAKQIDAILALLASNTKNIDDKISVINGRLDRGEGGETRLKEHKTETNMTVGTVLAIVAGAVGIIGLIAGLTFGVINHSAQSPSPAIVAPAVIPLQPNK